MHIITIAQVENRTSEVDLLWYEMTKNKGMWMQRTNTSEQKRRWVCIRRWNLFCVAISIHIFTDMLTKYFFLCFFALIQRWCSLWQPKFIYHLKNGVSSNVASRLYRGALQNDVLFIFISFSRLVNDDFFPSSKDNKKKHIIWFFSAVDSGFVWLISMRRWRDGVEYKLLSLFFHL